MKTDEELRYTTRILSNEKSPAWEEMAFLGVTTEDLEENERLRMTVLDHDKYAHDE